MKKRIFILIIPLLFMTGCTCEYNLEIEGNKFKEEIKLIADSSEEISQFNKKWEISTNKEDNTFGGDPSTTKNPIDNPYNYNLTNNTLTFSYDFSQNEYKNSLAVSKCYNNLTVTNYQDSIVISTPSKTICLGNYPPLNSIVINITTNKKVTSNNADNINGNTYTWKLNKTNATNKPINIVIDNSGNDGVASSASSGSSNTQKENNKKDYTMYIFSAILLIVVLLGYLVFNIIKRKNNNEDV